MPSIECNANDQPALTIYFQQIINFRILVLREKMLLPNFITNYINTLINKHSTPIDYIHNLGRFALYHQVHLRYVQPPSCHIRGNQHLETTLSETLEKVMTAIALPTLRSKQLP